MKFATRIAELMLIVALMGGCVTMKTGSGSAYGPDSVKFSWTASGNVAGCMTAKLEDGETFTGRYVQITSQLTDELGAQGPIWHQEGAYDVGPGLEHVPHYTGRVVATLRRSDGAQMRCQFELTRPIDGIAGGARGACRRPDGPSVNAQFPGA